MMAKEITTIFDTGWMPELREKINELVDGFNKLEKRVEEIEVCGPRPDVQSMWDSLDAQKRKKEALDALKRNWDEGWEIVNEFRDCLRERNMKITGDK